MHASGVLCHWELSESLTPMLLAATLANTKRCKKLIKKILKPWYSSESAQWELSNKYQHDRVYMVYENLRILVKTN